MCDIRLTEVLAITIYNLKRVRSCVELLRNYFWYTP